MERVSLFKDTYIQRMEINGTVMDLLLDSSILQKNMYECRQNIATYTVNILGGSMYVEGVVNTTHAIRPIKHRTKRSRRIPHKIFNIDKYVSGTDTKQIEAEFFESARIRRLRRHRKKLIRNGTVAPQRHRPEERGSPPNGGEQIKIARELRFEIEVHCVADAVLAAIYNFQRGIALYIATLMNVVKLKIRTMRLTRMSVRVVGIRSLREGYESDLVVLNGDTLDVHQTLGRFAHYVRADPMLSRADIAVLLTGRDTVSYKNGANRNNMGK
ncbi:uncharacterized protein LOC144158918 [Haemaphysalis longicornis]